MNVLTLIDILWARRRLEAHNRWTHEQLLAHRASGLAALRAYAVANSPFYRALHRGLEDAPLEALPIVTKANLMEHFDEVVTDRAINLADVEQYLRHASVTDLFRGRYRVAATGGTTGRRGVFIADPVEWRTIMASYMRVQAWAGLKFGPVRFGAVASRNPNHQSAIVGATLASRFSPTLRFDANDPIDEVVSGLNKFGPQVLGGYASMLSVLADEKRCGRLTIAPRLIISVSEVLTDNTRNRVRDAFDVEPTNMYVATEVGPIACECRAGRMHRCDDLVITEIVDEDNRPVAPGAFGAKLLITALFAHTQPLIRYELSDRVRAGEGSCPDGLPFSLLDGIEGREQEVLTLAGVTVHPLAFHAALGGLPVTGWQVIQQDAGLRILLAGATASMDLAVVRGSVNAALERLGVRGMPIVVDTVASIPRTALGKVPLVRRATTTNEPIHQ